MVVCRHVLSVSLLYWPAFSAGFSLACEGGLPGLLPESFFDTLELFQSRYLRDSLERSREFLYTMYLPKLAPNLQESALRCPAGVLEIMLNVILALDVDYSLSEAQSVYGDVMRLVSEGVLGDSTEETLTRWSHDTVRTYPFLFGDLSMSCFGSSVKVYVYDLPEGLRGPVLQCAGGQWGTEVLMHRFFEKAECRTTNPEEADFFYVPMYATCLSVKHGIANDGEAAALLWDPLVRFLDASPWFRRHGGRDHIFLFADGQSARIWDSYNLVRGESIFFMVEAKCPTWDEPARRYTDVTSCSSSWKDVIISGHTDHARAEEMRSHNRPTQERDLLMTFHGRHPDSHDVYESCVVRRQVMHLADKEGVDVGGFVDDYLERKGRSHFCLIPGGTSPWTNHLYESFFCGCIPVILSDEYEVAFQHVLDWPVFSIKWPEALVGEELYDFLRSFSTAQLEAMKEAVDRHACWFDYFSEDPACSPFLAAMLALEERKQRRPRHAGRFWGTAPALDEAMLTAQRRTTRFHVNGSESFIVS